MDKKEQVELLIMNVLLRYPIQKREKIAREIMEAIPFALFQPASVEEILAEINKYGDWKNGVNWDYWKKGIALALSKLQFKEEGKYPCCDTSEKQGKHCPIHQPHPENEGVCECGFPIDDDEQKLCGLCKKPLPPQECKHEAFYHPVCVHCGKLVDDDYLIKTEKIPPQEKGIEELKTKDVLGVPFCLEVVVIKLVDKVNELIRAFNSRK